MAGQHPSGLKHQSVWMDSHVILSSLQNPSGTMESKFGLSSTWKVSKEAMCPSSIGMLPLKSLDDKRIELRLDMLPIWLGMVECKLLLLKSRTVRLVKSPSVEGMLPFIPESERLNSRRLGRLTRALIGRSASRVVSVSVMERSIRSKLVRKANSGGIDLDVGK